MPINIPQAIQVTGRFPIDTRLVLTQEEMRNIIDARMPDKYFALCKDDNKLYVYESNNNPSTQTGRFRVYKADIEPIAIKNMLNNQLEKNTGLIVDDNGLKLSINENQFQIKDNKLNISIDVIQAQ